MTIDGECWQWAHYIMLLVLSAWVRYAEDDLACLSMRSRAALCIGYSLTVECTNSAQRTQALSENIEAKFLH